MNGITNTNDLITEQELAEWLRRSPATLRNWRTRREGPAHIKTRGSVVYARQDVVDWLNANRVRKGA